MYRRLHQPGDRWLAGILSAIFLCLVLALGGSAASLRAAAPTGVSPAPVSGRMDGSHQPSTRFLADPHRPVVVSAAKSDKGWAPGHGDGADPAILPEAIALPRYPAERRFVAAIRHAPNGREPRGYNARAPPALT